MLIDEQIAVDGARAHTELACRDGRLLLCEGGAERALPAQAIAAVMRRYGRELDPDVAPVGESLAVPGGLLQRLRHWSPVDAEARDYLVWTERGRPPVAAMSCHVAAALRHLAAAANPRP